MPLIKGDRNEGEVQLSVISLRKRNTFNEISVRTKVAMRKCLVLVHCSRSRAKVLAPN